MPRSQQPRPGQDLVVKYILANSDRDVLDVGCGDGKWSDLLFRKVRKLDGVEIWPPYVSKYNLEAKYDHLYVQDVMEFVRADLLRCWDVFILGDVLEHLPKGDGEVLLQEIQRLNRKFGKECFLVIPTGGRWEQDGTVYGNPYETHVSFWPNEEIIPYGFELLHEGTNPNGLVTIGTYRMPPFSNGSN